MKKLFWVTSIIITLFLIPDCKKDPNSLALSPNLPVLLTVPITNITATSAVCGGDIISNGGAPITSNGVCWSTSFNPSITDSKTVDSVRVAQFVSNITGLTTETTYHVRAYTTNLAGTAYGNDMTFSTLALEQRPECSTLPASNISATRATLNGTVNSNNLSTTVTFEFSTLTTYEQTITCNQSPLNGNNITNVSTEITGLTPATTYLFRIKAVNDLGTSYGYEMAFTTKNINQFN